MAQRGQRSQYSRIADHDVELLPALVDGRPKRIDLVMVLQIKGEQRCIAAEGADLVIDLFQRARGAADQDQMRALFGVGQGNRPADAAGGSGNEGKAAGEAWCWAHGRTASPRRAALASRIEAVARGLGCSVLFLRRVGLCLVDQVFADANGLVVGLLRGFLGLFDIRLGGFSRPFRRLLGLVADLLGFLHGLVGVGFGLLTRLIGQFERALGADGG